jgi:phage terminase large subunit-like protein
MKLGALKGDYAYVVKKYVKDVIDGKIIAGEDRVLGCKRFVAMLDNKDYVVDADDADYVIRIIETQIKHRQGQTLEGLPLRGKPFVLLPWQKFCIYGMLIFYKKGKKRERLVKEAFLYLARKNGKTIFAAALAWALALLDGESGSKCYVVGAALKQAKETYDTWLYSLTGSSMYDGKKEAQRDGWRILDNNMEHSISNERILVDGLNKAISLNAIASNPDAQDSFNANLIIADELHAYKSPNQYNVLKEATKAYTNKLVIGITTAGKDGTGFCAQRLKYCQGVLRGVNKDESYFIFICKADDGIKDSQDLVDEVQFAKANPSYGETIRPDDITNDALQAMADPQQRKDFLSKSLNIFVSADSAYFEIDEFRKSNAEAAVKLGIDDTLPIAEKIYKISKLPIKWYGGADLSKLHDLTAASLHGQYKGVDIAITRAWFPLVLATAKADRDKIPLFGWQDDGVLEMCTTPTNDHKRVVAWFKAMRDMGFKIMQVGHDRKFCREYFAGMTAAKFKIVDQPQYTYKKSEGFRHIEKQAKNGNLYYLGNNAYEYCIQNVAAIEKSDDMIEYHKLRANARIDVFDADVFATVRMLEGTEKDESKSRYWNG